MTRVGRLPSDPGPTGWNAILAPPSPARALEAPVTADWLVIGGGFAGLAAARRITQLRAGDQIVLLEAARIGSGPAGRNSGFMIDVPHKWSSDSYAGAADADRTQIALNRAAIAFWGEAADEYRLSEEAYAQCGKVNAAASERGEQANRAYAAHLEALGEPLENLDAAAMCALTGSDYYRGGVFTPGTAMIQPALFVRSVAEGLAGRVEIYEQTPVVSLARSGPDWRAETPAGAVTAPRTILAVNGHAESFGYFRRRLVHIHLYASMTRQLTEEEVRGLGGAPRWGLTPSDPMGSTVRRISGTGGDRLVIRNGVTYTPNLAGAAPRLPAMQRRHAKSLGARYPALGDVGFEYGWGGRLCLSLNDVPAFGEVEPGLFSACCQNGLGTTRGTAAGMLAADLAAHGNTPLLEKMLAFDPPKRLPPDPFAWLGANAQLKWREWRAGKEV